MAKIKLSNGGYAIVDDEDVERLSGIRWHRVKNKNREYVVGYVASLGISVLMHRYILALPVVIEARIRPIVHYINGNGLDNRKINLTILSYEQHSDVHRTPGTSETDLFDLPVSKPVDKP